ncbi:MAG: hypothetical protein KA314_23275 [Chloroflexi bacterium]|nr:hypothetical protein [Chloroflexota bacterium]MBP8058767.1 hypothetical protein [Chloroflexota bacterium]
MSSLSPRARALLRQAAQTAAANKRSAAEQLYRQIVQEFPDLAEGWVGLADVLTNLTEKQAAYQQALAINPNHPQALEGQERLANGTIKGNSTPTPDVLSPPQYPSAPAELFSPAPPAPFQASQASDEEVVLYCSTHPNVRTNLRCYSCGKLICSRCARHTPVGWRCNTCIHEAQEVFFNAEAIHYFLAFISSAIVAALGGLIVPMIGYFTIFLAAGMGTLIGRVAFRLTGRRRGRYLPHTVAAAIVIGGLLPALFVFLASLAVLGLTGDGFFLGRFDLVWRVVYVILAAGSAYYQVR